MATQNLTLELWRIRVGKEKWEKLGEENVVASTGWEQLLTQHYDVELFTFSFLLLSILRISSDDLKME